MRGFADRFPALFHVADRAALPSIRKAGLLCAAGLCDRYGVAPADRPALLDGNRNGYAVLAPGVALRWQGMNDGPLARRLVPGLDVAGWRRLINGKVFLFASPLQAARLRAAEPGRDQVVLRFGTAALLAAGLDLRACAFNNGFIDRRPLAAPRLRGPADYVPVAEWRGARPAEVTVEGSIPPGHGFTVMPPEP